MVCLLVLILITFAVYRTLRTNKNLDNLGVRKKMQTLYEGLRTDRNEALNYTTWFLLRRLMIACSFKYGKFFTVQLFINQNLSFFIFWYMSNTKPFCNPSLLSLCLMNELFLIFFTDLVFLKTGFMDVVERFDHGWIYIVCFLVHMILNLCSFYGKIYR